MSDLQTVDVTVSRRKFDREVAQYRDLEALHRRRGWFLIDARFPEVFVIFAAEKLKPPAIACAVVLDFTNYDLQPPSVKFVNPFTREPLKFKDLQFSMLRRAKVPGATPQTVTAMLQTGQLTLQPLIQAHNPDDVPFLCLPGVREYHEHPGHTGDSWLLHRRSGEGSLNFILDQIWTCGVRPIDRLEVQVQVQANVKGVMHNSMLIPE